MARKVVLAGACRTAIGVMGGQFANTSAVELGTIVIKEALKRAGVSPDQVDEVYMGNVIQAGNGQNPARQAAVYAGIPNEVPATTINVLCWIRSSLCKPCSEADRSWRCRYHRCRWYGKYDNGSVHVEKRTLWISYGKCDNRRCYDQGWSDRCIP